MFPSVTQLYQLADQRYGNLPTEWCNQLDSNADPKPLHGSSLGDICQLLQELVPNKSIFNAILCRKVPVKQLAK